MGGIHAVRISNSSIVNMKNCEFSDLNHHAINVFNSSTLIAERLSFKNIILAGIYAAKQSVVNLSYSNFQYMPGNSLLSHSSDVVIDKCVFNFRWILICICFFF